MKVQYQLPEKGRGQEVMKYFQRPVSSCLDAPEGGRLFFVENQVLLPEKITFSQATHTR
jgi:hypothetical protein